MTTFNLGERGTEDDLAAGLRALGFAVSIETEPGSESWITVSHEADDVGRLDGHVYAEVPRADIVRTSGPAGTRRKSVDQTGDQSGDEPRHRAATG